MVFDIPKLSHRKSEIEIKIFMGIILMDFSRMIIFGFWDRAPVSGLFSISRDFRYRERSEIRVEVS